MVLSALTRGDWVDMTVALLIRIGPAVYACPAPRPQGPKRPDRPVCM